MCSTNLMNSCCRLEETLPVVLVVSTAYRMCGPLLLTLGEDAWLPSQLLFHANIYGLDTLSLQEKDQLLATWCFLL